jgi:hypothetical protein
MLPETFPPLKPAGGVRAMEYKQDPLCVREPLPSTAVSESAEDFCATVNVEVEIPASCPVPAHAALEVADENCEETTVTSTWIFESETGLITALVSNGEKIEKIIVTSPKMMEITPTIVAAPLRDFFFFSAISRSSSSASFSSSDFSASTSASKSKRGLDSTGTSRVESTSSDLLRFDFFKRSLPASTRQSIHLRGLSEKGLPPSRMASGEWHDFSFGQERTSCAL